MGTTDSPQNLSRSAPLAHSEAAPRARRASRRNALTAAAISLLHTGIAHAQGLDTQGIGQHDGQRLKPAGRFLPAEDWQYRFTPPTASDWTQGVVVGASGWQSTPLQSFHAGNLLEGDSSAFVSWPSPIGTDL